MILVTRQNDLQDIMDAIENLALVETNGCHLLCYADEAFATRLPAFGGDAASLLKGLGLPPMPVKLASHTHVRIFASIVDELASRYEAWRMLDVGGYIGAIGIPVAKWASSRFTPTQARIEIFEPTRMSELLARSVRLNQLETFVQIHAYAVSNVNGTSVFNSLANQRVAGHLGGVKMDNSTIVETVALDSRYPHVSGELILAKVDTEGHEPRVLEGMQALLSRNNVVGIFEFHEFCLGQSVGLQKYEDFLFEHFRIFNVGNIGYPKLLQEVGSGSVDQLRAHANRDGNRLTDLVCFDRRLPQDKVDRIVAPYLTM